MSQRADTDSVNARSGDPIDRVDIHSARSLQQNLRSTLISHVDRFAELFAGHVVQQNNIAFGIQRDRQLIQRIDFQLQDRLFAVR